MPEFWRSYSVPVAAIAEATTRIRLGTNVVMGFVRSPYISARVAADLDELSDGRLVLGLGSGSLHPGSEDGWAVGRERPSLDGLRDLVEVLRYAWRTWFDAPGEPLDYDSEHCTLHVPGLVSSRRPVRREVPVHLGVRLPRAIQLAGEIADGLIMFPGATSRHVREEVRPNLTIGAERAGRDMETVELVGMYVCCVSDDREEARQLAGQQLSLYAEGGTVPGSSFERDGFAAEWKRLREARLAQDLSAIAEATSDEMLDAYAIAGDRDEVRARVAELEGVVDVAILEAPSWRCSEEQILASHRAVIEAFVHPARRSRARDALRSDPFLRRTIRRS